MLRRPKALLFDLDGTLIDSRGDIAAAANHALVKSGRSALAPETIATMVGDGSRALLARAFDVPIDSALLDDAMANFSAYYMQFPAKFSTFLAGAEEALQTVHGLKTALVTNKPRAVTLAVIEAMDMAKYFSSVTAGGDGPLKPAPDPIFRVARELGVAPEDAWMIGDGPQDVASAHAAGATAVAVRGGFLASSRVEAEKPDAWIDSLMDLAPLVRARRHAGG